MNPTRAHLSASRNLGFLLLATTMACGSSASDAGTTESGVTVTPTGDDHPGQLVVTVPAGVTPTDTNDAFTIGGSAPVAFTTPYTLPIGDHTLNIRSCRGQDCGGWSLPFTIQNHATTTVALGAIAFKRTGSDGLLGIDAAIAADGMTANVGTQWVAEDQLQTVAYRLPLAYTYTFGLFDGFDTTVEPSKIDTIDLDVRTNRRQVRIVAPARALGDAAMCKGWTITGKRTDRSKQSAAGIVIPSGTVVLLGEHVTDASQTGEYWLRTGPGDVAPAKFTLGDTGGDPATLNVGRIDVTDVAVKQNDGTTANVRGQYTISRVTTNTAGGEVLDSVCAGQTNTGVDVLPGTYRLVTTYSTVEVGTKTTTQDVTVP